MQMQQNIYWLTNCKTSVVAFNAIGLTRLGGGNSLIINGLEQKPNHFSEILLQDIQAALMALKALMLPSFLFHFHR